MPNYNQSGGLSRQDRAKLAGASSGSQAKGFVWIAVGLVMFIVFLVLRFGNILPEPENGEAGIMSYFHWLFAAIGILALAKGSYDMNGQNADVVAKRQQKAERKAQRKAEKARRK